MTRQLFLHPVVPGKQGSLGLWAVQEGSLSQQYSTDCPAINLRLICNIAKGILTASMLALPVGRPSARLLSPVTLT